MTARVVALLLAFGLVLTLSARSQQISGLAKIAKTDLREQPKTFRLFSGSDEDQGRRAPLFNIEMTPDGDLLCLIAMQSGPWRLIRVRDWTTQRPVVQRLNVPEYGASPPSSDFSIAPQMLITRDAKYLVIVAPDSWPRGSDATVTVVDLGTFSLIVTQRASKYGLVGNWQLGPEDSIEVQGQIPSPGKPLGSEDWLAILLLPGLRVVDRCDYAIAFNSPNSVTPLRAEIHGRPSSRCAQEAKSLVAHQTDPGELQKLSAMLNPACSIEATTPDRRYATGTCRDCRQTLFGVSCKPEKSEVYASGFNKAIASMIHAPHKLTRSLITQLQGKLYLLSVENAQALTVYQVEAPPETVSHASGQP